MDNNGLGRLPDGTGLSSATLIEPVPVSPVPASIPSAGWAAGSFNVSTEDGIAPIAGWLKSPFALDFRVFRESAWGDDEGEGGWQVTHLPSGLKVCGILGPLGRATMLVDVLASRADWASCQAGGEANFVRPFAKFKEENAGVVVRWGTLFSPLLKWPASAIEAEMAETGTGSVRESAVANGDTPNPIGDNQ